MLKRLKIKVRFMVSFFIIVLLTIFIVGIGVGSLQDSNLNFVEYNENAVELALHVKDCRIATLQVSADVQNLLMTTDNTKKQKLQAELVQEEADFYNSLATVRELYEEDETDLDAYENAANEWFSYVDDVLAGFSSGNTSDSAKFADNLDVLEDKLAVAATAVSDQLESHRTREAGINEKSTNVAILVLMGAFLVQLALTIIISTALTKSIVKPINELDMVAREMAKGNLNQEIHYRSHDAVGELAESLRSMISVLSSYVRDIDRAMGEMANANFDIKPSQPFIGDFKHIEDSITKFIMNMSKTINGMQRAAVVVNSAADQVSMSSQSLARGATEQASSIEQLSAALAEISNSIDENAISAGAASDQSTVVMKEFITSDGRMQSLVKAMGEINKSSDEISKIIKTIDDIAFQTNILALNAAVEAARAGSAGKGFAVVADEVRNLASKSADAAKNTTTLIENSIKAVENGSKIAQETAQSLSGVLEGAKTITVLVEKISTTSKEQSNSTRQIVQNVETISDVVQNNAASAEESAAASEELSGQAQMLRSITARFHLGDFAIAAAEETVAEKSELARF